MFRFRRTKGQGQGQGQGVSTAAIESGMTKEQVEGLLGRPHHSFTEEEFRQGRPVVVVRSGEDFLLQNEYCFYSGFPKKGIMTMITFHKGRVQKVTQGND